MLFPLPLKEFFKRTQNCVKANLLTKLQQTIVPRKLHWCTIWDPPTRHSISAGSIYLSAQFVLLHRWPRILAVDKLDKIFCVFFGNFELRIIQVFVEVLEQVCYVEDMASFTLETAFPRYALIEVVEKQFCIGRVWPTLGKCAGGGVEADFRCKAQDGKQCFVI